MDYLNIWCPLKQVYILYVISNIILFYLKSTRITVLLVLGIISYDLLYSIIFY